MIKEYFNTEEEKEVLILKYKDKYITDIAYLKNGDNYIIFSDIPNDIPIDRIDEVENKISILEAENADLLIDSAMKDLKIETLENDLADLTLEIAMMGVK